MDTCIFHFGETGLTATDIGNIEALAKFFGAGRNTRFVTERSGEKNAVTSAADNPFASQARFGDKIAVGAASTTEKIGGGVRPRTHTAAFLLLNIGFLA